ncbi:MAG: molybdate ABC transporter substrate-binding protein [Alphaproteobacteria bacterium]|nr:molybdate ABC transporter substrate-binding protein [Alphaproteobacteria bacterium]MBV9062873.1 molybdate ABC transporter substrate-binding protein [Alphaproteobacteria bacterium]
MTRFFASLMAAAALLIVGAARASDITVFAAASLTDALNRVNTAYQKKTGHTAAISFAASSVLARQIEASQGADVFISADTDWMDELDKHGLIARETRRDLLGNHLVLIAPATSGIALKVSPNFNIAKALDGGRLALADPESVPAGKYAKAALGTLGVWDAIAGQIAPAENVRAALAYVARGEAPLGVVYTTDAMAEPHVRVVDTFPDNTHPPIVYPVALTKDAKPLAREFLDYLATPESADTFRKAGFLILSGAK